MLEGVAFSLYSCVKQIESLEVTVKDFRVIGGGASSPLWRQILCDIVGKSLIRPHVDDSSFGTALVGGLGVGLFSSVQEAMKRCVTQVDILTPNEENHQLYRSLFEVYEKVSEDLSDSSRLLHQILP